MHVHACASNGDSIAGILAFWKRGGRFLVYFLEATTQGKKTPVPPRDALLPELGAMALRGGSTTKEPWWPYPHAGEMLRWGQPKKAPAGGTGCGGPGGGLQGGCQTIIAWVGCSGAGESTCWWLEVLTLTNVTITLLLDEEQTTCCATSALLPRITSSVLQWCCTSC